MVIERVLTLVHLSNIFNNCNIVDLLWTNPYCLRRRKRHFGLSFFSFLPPPSPLLKTACVVVDNELEMGKNRHLLGSVLFGFYEYQGSVRFGFLSIL